MEPIRPGLRVPPKVRYYIMYICYYCAQSNENSRISAASHLDVKQQLYGGGSPLHCMRHKRAAPSTFSCSKGRGGLSYVSPVSIELVVVVKTGPQNAKATPVQKKTPVVVVFI